LRRHKHAFSNVKKTWVARLAVTAFWAARFEENGMSKSADLVKYKAQPGKRDELKRVWEKYVRDYVVNRTASLSYYYCYDTDDPDTIIVFGVSDDPASGQEFVKQPWFRDFQQETTALLAGPVEVQRATVRWEKGGTP
jgi:quinol monooxygenase YgiN